MQLVDELSMIYTTCLMAWGKYVYRPLEVKLTLSASLSHGKSVTLATFYGAVLSFIAGSITLVYHHLQDPTFHQNAYALLTATLLFRSWYLMETRLRRIDPAAVNIMWWLVGWGLVVFMAGFGLWNLDNAYCGVLRSWRRDVGLPWGILSEGHGWWHLLTGVGAYYYIVYGELSVGGGGGVILVGFEGVLMGVGIYLRHCLNGDQDKFDLVWPSLLSLPVINRKKVSRRDGVNGESRKRV